MNGKNYNFRSNSVLEMMRHREKSEKAELIGAAVTGSSFIKQLSD